MTIVLLFFFFIAYLLVSHSMLFIWLLVSCVLSPLPASLIPVVSDFTLTWWSKKYSCLNPHLSLWKYFIWFPRLDLSFSSEFLKQQLIQWQFLLLLCSPVLLAFYFVGTLFSTYSPPYFDFFSLFAFISYPT